MAVSNKSQLWFLSRYRALYGKIDSPEGYQSWMDEASIDEQTFIEAFHRICDQRRENEQYAAYDKPKLLELQAVYFKMLREKRAGKELDALHTSCGFCESRGRRFLVVHTNHRLEDGEVITGIPADTESIRRWVYVLGIPCVCAIGEVIMMHNKAVYSKKTAMTAQRRHEILKLSLTAKDAGRLQHDYLKHRNVKFHGRTLEEQKSDPKFVASCQKALNAYKKGRLNMNTTYTRKAPDPDPVEHAWDDDDDESSIPF